MIKNDSIEKITNRIFINFGIAILSYIFLWILISKFNMDCFIVFIVAGIFFVSALFCFILYLIKKYNIKNYAYMLAVFSVLLLITQSSFIVSNIIGINKFSSLIRNYPIMRVIFDTANDVKFIAVAGAVYLIIMLVYNCVIISRISKYRI